MPKIEVNNIDKDLLIDDINKSLNINNSITQINLNDIIRCDLIETRGSYGKTGFAKAFSTSFLGEQSHILTSFCIEIQTSEDTYLFELLKTPLKSNTFIFKNIKKNAEQFLVKIKSYVPDSPVVLTNLSYIEELRELKKLLNENILTQEEFEQKKQRILNSK